MTATIPGSQILSIAHRQPTRLLSNDGLTALVDTSDAWIRSRVGIATRHIAAEDESVADMAIGAAAAPAPRAQRWSARPAPLAPI
ncbi:3-oxoacyl-(acyl carrier protein) synthase III [Streptomyces sp. 769]|nr:3-oxoacyl-(acyl carrier protein) synthase III [Streptomyces sp. 769]AJC61857.1 3-oxoacyl-(acyl carrier protein) synthase III [Streptomyces sp. 769]